MWNISQESQLNPAVGNDYHLVKFGQNFEAIFRENGSLPDNRNTTIAFLIPNSSFPQIWPGLRPPRKLFQTPDPWIVSPGASKGWHPNKYYEEVAEKEEYEILHMDIRQCKPLN